MILPSIPNFYFMLKMKFFFEKWEFFKNEFGNHLRLDYKMTVKKPVNSLNIKGKYPILSAIELKWRHEYLFWVFFSKKKEKLNKT